MCLCLLEFLQPYKPRPVTSAVAARRLVTGALGMQPRLSKEQRDEERKVLKEARGKGQSFCYYQFYHTSLLSICLCVHRSCGYTDVCMCVRERAREILVPFLLFLFGFVLFKFMCFLCVFFFTSKKSLSNHEHNVIWVFLSFSKEVSWTRQFGPKPPFLGMNRQIS